MATTHTSFAWLWSMMARHIPREASGKIIPPITVQQQQSPPNHVDEGGNEEENCLFETYCIGCDEFFVREGDVCHLENVRAIEDNGVNARGFLEEVDLNSIVEDVPLASTYSNRSLALLLSSSTIFAFSRRWESPPPTKSSSLTLQSVS